MKRTYCVAITDAIICQNKTVPRAIRNCKCQYSYCGPQMLYTYSFYLFNLINVLHIKKCIGSKV